MWNMIWPIGLVVVANTFYNICAKATPAEANPFLSLMVTYLMGAAVCLLIFAFSKAKGGFGTELGKLNWTAIVLGIVIVGLEVGYIFIYRAGWQVSNASVTANICLACVLLLIGTLVYRETFTLKKLIGLAVCGAGLWLVSK